MKEEVAHQVFRRQFSFQLGQVLGLRANNASRYAYSPEQLRDKEWVAEHGISSSMMDCALVDYLVQPGDGVAFEDLFGHVSHYDRWALEYAYRCFPQGNEKEAIRDLLMEAKGNPYLAYAAKEKDALEPYDLSSDMLEAVKLGMKNIDAAWLQVEQLSAELDEENSWYTYVDLTNGLLETYTSYIVALQQHIGKINIQPSIKGYTDHVWTFMPRAEQKAAADYMIQKTYSGIPEWMQHTRLRGLSGYNGEQTLTYMMRRTSQFVTNPNMLNRLLQTEIEQPGKSYTATELFSAVYKAVFGNFSTSMAINRFNCRAQYLFVEAFVNNYVAADVVKNMGTSVSDFMILQMRKMLDGMERLSKTHATAAGREHYRGLYVFTKQFLASTDQKIKERAAAKKPAAKALTAMQYDGSCNMDWQ